MDYEAVLLSGQEALITEGEMLGGQELQPH